MIRKITLWFLVVITAISMAGCGSLKSADTAAIADQMESNAENGIVATSNNAEGKTDVKFSSAVQKDNTAEQQQSTQNQSILPDTDVSQKVIFKGQIDFETLDFGKTTTELINYISTVGGYQQSSSVHGGRIGYTGLRSAEYIFRIPKTKYMQAFIDLKKFGAVVFEQSSGEDITDKYFDTEARLKSLRVRQDRLMALLEKAVKMEDILKIEKDLQETLYEIENYTGTLRKWDSLVEYSTLSVNVREVAEIKPEVKENDGLFTRIAVGFKSSITGVWEFIQDFLVFIAQALPVIIPLGAIAYLVYRAIRKRIKKTGNKKAESKIQTSEHGEAEQDAGSRNQD